MNTRISAFFATTAVFLAGGGFLYFKGSSVASDVDLNGKVYIIDEKSDFIVFKSNGDTLKKFSVTNYGAQPLIDASNPIEPVVFFPLTGKMVWFDNQLNIRNETNLYNSGAVQILCAGRSNDGLAWVFDGLSKSLKKVNKVGFTEQESVLISDFAEPNRLRRIYDNGRKVAFQDEDGRIYQFNPNLSRLKDQRSDGLLIGMSEEELIVCEAGVIYAIDKQDTKKRIGVFDKGVHPIRYINGYQLSSDSTGLFLQRGI